MLGRWRPPTGIRQLVDDGALDVVVVGGGPTGIESVGALAELYSSNFSQDYPDVCMEQARLTLVEAGPTLFPMFRKDIQEYTTRILEKRGSRRAGRRGARGVIAPTRVGLGGYGEELRRAHAHVEHRPAGDTRWCARSGIGTWGAGYRHRGRPGPARCPATPTCTPSETWRRSVDSKRTGPTSFRGSGSVAGGSPVNRRATTVERALATATRARRTRATTTRAAMASDRARSRHGSDARGGGWRGTAPGSRLGAVHAGLLPAGPGPGTGGPALDDRGVDGTSAQTDASSSTRDERADAVEGQRLDRPAAPWSSTRLRGVRRACRRASQRDDHARASSLSASPRRRGAGERARQLNAGTRARPTPCVRCG